MPYRMFHPWLSSSTHQRRTISTIRTQHVEIIGGSRAPLPPVYLSPRLPTELTTEILVLAGVLLQEEDASSSSSHRAILQLARVDKNAYQAILTRVLLPSIDIQGVAQVKAWQAALKSSIVGLDHLVQRSTRRLCVTIAQGKGSNSGRSTLPNTGRGGSRASLYDHLSRSQEFDKEALVPLGLILSRCIGLTALHLETTPGLLLTRKSDVSSTHQADRSSTPAQSAALHLIKCNLQELSCLLSFWGGAGLEDLFFHLTKVPNSSDHQPWSNLTHLQIHGPAGFRVSLPTSSAIGALPSLSHLALVMPNIVRDAGMAGDVNSPPAALQLLVLLADKLQRLIFVGHTLEGYLGWAPLYRAWLRALRLPMREDLDDHEDKAVRPTLTVQLVTARVQDHDGDGEMNAESGNSPWMPANQPHPNHFTSWMIARAKEGSHWCWSKLPSVDEDVRKAGADEVWNVHWSVEEWEVPTVEGVSPDHRQWQMSNGGEVGERSEEEQQGVFSSYTVRGATSPLPNDVVYGIDNLD